LPAYIGGIFKVAGIKWVSSFPENVGLGLDRASAAILLNCVKTGRPLALLEGSIISAKRTAASAALAAQCLQTIPRATRAGLIGCGLINFEIARFLRAACPEITSFAVHDLNAGRARQFQKKCGEVFRGVDVEVTDDIDAVLSSCRLISFATTATRPHVNDLSGCHPGTTILHISLRDIAPKAILSADNVVDDPDHVCRAQTSVHLAEQLVGNRDFIRSSLAAILTMKARPRSHDGRTVIFSPFGLGVLDMAVSNLAYRVASEQSAGQEIDSFLPRSWIDQEETGNQIEDRAERDIGEDRQVTDCQS